MTTETVLPQGWEIKRLGDIANYVNGRAFKPTEWSKAGTPIIRIQNLNNPNAEYNYHEGEIEQKYHIKNGDLLFAWSASLGAYIWNGENAFLNQHIFKVLPKENIDKTFLYYLLDKITNELYAKAHGSGMVHVTKGKFEATLVAIPPLPTQQAIVNKIETLFADIDAGIDSLKNAQMQLKQYRQSLLKNAFNGELTKDWREQNAEQLPTASELLTQIQTAREAHHKKQLADWQNAVKEWEQAGKIGKKPSKPKKLREFVQLTEGYLPDLPKEWCWVELSSISSAIRIGPFGSLLHKADYINNGIPLINPSHIKNRKIVPDFQLTVSKEKLKELNNYIMRESDIVIGRRGEMGRCAVVTSNENGWLCGTGSMFVRPLNSMNSEFVAHIISSERVRDYLSSLSIGTTMQNLNEKILHTVPIPLCSPQEQLEILRILDAGFIACDTLATELAIGLKQAELLKQAVLKSAFLGGLIQENGGENND